MKKFTILSLLCLINGLLVYGLFVLFLTGGFYKSGLWYLWIVLGLFTPVLPILSKWIRAQKGIAGKINNVFEVISIILCLFDFAIICTYGLDFQYGNELGWMVLIIVSIVYSKINVTETQSEDSKREEIVFNNHDELDNRPGFDMEESLYCRKCGAKIELDSIYCNKCGEKVIK